MFDKVYCINLDERKDRWEDFQNQIDILGMRDKLVRISAMKPPQNYFLPNQLRSGQMGCTLSHIKMLGHALKNAKGNVLVLEDDILVNQDSSELMRECINSLPQDWAICYFGGQPRIRLSLYKQNQKYKIFNAKNIEGSYAYAINYNVMHELFNHCMSCLIDDNMKINRNLKVAGIYDYTLYSFANKTKSFISYPLMVRPAPGTSSITGGTMTEQQYDDFIKKFWKKCL